MAKESTTKPAEKKADILAPMKAAIKAHLDARAAEDPQFAERYANPKKNIAECCRYIIGEAKTKSAGANCVAIPDAEVFGMAVHYYDEEDIKIHNVPIRQAGVAAPAAAPVKLTEEQKKAAERKAIEAFEEAARRKLEERERARKKAVAERRKAGREEAQGINDAWASSSLFDL